MRPFKTYLRAELGKLRNAGDAACFLESTSRDVVRACGLPVHADEITHRLRTQESVNAFVETLSEGNARRLAQACSQNWRRNSVFVTLEKHASWRDIDAPVEAITLCQAEPALGAMFRENEHRLARIATDERILSTEHYSGRQPGATIAFPICLAERRANSFRIFDGVHRAIQLVRNGARTIPLCCADEKHS